MSKHPIQPLYRDDQGTVRFKANAIVRFLLDAGPYDLNKLAMMHFLQEDHEQFAQLIGYSLSGFGDLSYVSDETYKRAEDQAFNECLTVQDSKEQILFDLERLQERAYGVEVKSLKKPLGDEIRKLIETLRRASK